MELNASKAEKLRDPEKQMMNALRLLLTVLTILCGTTIAGAAMPEAHAGVIF
jgi:hypothetical protein